MNDKKISYIIRLMMLMLLTKSCATYAQQTSEHKKDWQIKAGIAAIVSAPAWVGNDVQISAVPYFSAQYGNWSFGVENLVEYQLPVSKNIKILWGIKPRTDGFDPEFSLFSNWSNDDVFDDYESPDTEFLTYSTLQLSWLSIGVAYDVSGSSDAGSANVNLALPVFDNNRGMQVKVIISADFFSREYVNHYYGITLKQENLNVGRSQYLVDDYGLNVSFGMQLIYPLNRRWSVMGNVTYTQLDDLVADSPLIDGDNEQQAIVALLYRF